MLNRIKLTNFQRHRSLEITFNAGISALRGSNEAGKSTLIRSICYALFGAKALPVSLDETVTWGEPVNSLKVELELNVDGVVYTIKRGKSGAEITYDGGIVTGQNECTAFVGKLLKADAGAASRLMLANQNEIRGALASGAPETTKLIERLAEFDQLDNLIELMQEELTLGSAAGAEAAIAAAEQQLEQARSESAPPDLSALDKAIADAADADRMAERDLAGNSKLIDDLTTQLNAEQRKCTAKTNAADAVEQASKRLARAQEELEQSLAVAKPGEVDLDALRNRLVALQGIDKLRAAHKAVTALPSEPPCAADQRFEGTPDTLSKEIAEARQAALHHAKVARDFENAAERAQASIQAGACSMCGQDVSHLPEVSAKNAEFAGAAMEALKAAEASRRIEKEFTEYLEALEAVQQESAPRLRLIDQYRDYVSADALLPPTITWTGGDVPDDAAGEANEIRRTITQAEAANAAWTAAQARATAYRAGAKAAAEELEAAQAALAELPDGNTDPTLSYLEAAKAERRVLEVTARDAQRAVSAAQHAKQQAVDNHQRAVRAAEQAEKTLAARRKELKELGFNNALMKAVRGARPIIADKLWSLILGAVGRYFSEMRGVKSRVTKDGDGFKVDGHTASTLSGSTLDILGLAIRVALTRTFLPTAPFLVLDEPAAAMDGERTELMLGFLVQAGFPQTLLVTHEDISESVANNIITI